MAKLEIERNIEITVKWSHDMTPKQALAVVVKACTWATAWMLYAVIVIQALLQAIVTGQTFWQVAQVFIFIWAARSAHESFLQASYSLTWWHEFKRRHDSRGEGLR
jgi:hypothetical protein